MRGVRFVALRFRTARLRALRRKWGSTRPRYRCSLGRPHRPQCRGVTPLFGVGRGSSRPSFHRLGPDVLLYADSTAEVKPSLPYPHPPSQEGGVAFGKIVVMRRTGVQLNARAPLFSGSASILPGAADTFWCLGCRALAMPRFWRSLGAPSFPNRLVVALVAAPSPQCAMCSLRRRAAVKGLLIWCVGETRGTAGGRLGYGRCLRSAGCAPMT